MSGHFTNAFLALVFSVLIWSAVGAQLSQEETFSIDFRLRFPDDVAVKYEGRFATGGTLVIHDLEVKVRGPRERVARLAESDIVGMHDFTRESEREALRELLLRKQDVVRLRKEDLSLPEGLEVVSTVPDKVQLEFSRVKVKDIEVRADLVGTPAPGFAVGIVEVRPSVVSVKGPEALLAQFPGPYRTEPISIEGKGQRLVLTGRQVLGPAGVTVQQQVEVIVELVPAPVERRLTFPVHILRSTTRERTIRPVNFAVEPFRQERWACELSLRGPPEVLADLEARLRQELADPGSQRGLPLAYVRSGEFDLEDGAVEPLDVGVVGLPKGVEYVTVEKFTIKVSRVE